jgi:hypothetical protein
METGLGELVGFASHQELAISLYKMSEHQVFLHSKFQLLCQFLNAFKSLCLSNQGKSQHM